MTVAGVQAPGGRLRSAVLPGIKTCLAEMCLRSPTGGSRLRRGDHGKMRFRAVRPPAPIPEPSIASGTDGLHDSPLGGSGFEPSVPGYRGTTVRDRQVRALDNVLRCSKAVRNSNLQYLRGPCIKLAELGRRPTSVPVPQFLLLSAFAARTHMGLLCRTSLSSRGSSSADLRVCRFEPPHSGAGCRGLRSTAAKLTLQRQLSFVAPHRNLRRRYRRSRE